MLNKPMQLRLPWELRTKITRIAEKNHLSEADVVRLCLAQVLPGIEKHGLMVLPVDGDDNGEGDSDSKIRKR